MDEPVIINEASDAADFAALYRDLHRHPELSFAEERWILGGADPSAFAGAVGAAGMVRAMEGVPSNHSPLYAPVIEPTLGNGIAALVTAAREWLGATTA